jgi:hypothetical protein
VSGRIPLDIIAFKGINKIWGIGNDGVKLVLWRVFAQVSMNYFHPILPIGCIDVDLRLFYRFLINVNSRNGGLASLGQHESHESASSADIQDFF